MIKNEPLADMRNYLLMNLYQIEPRQDYSTINNTHSCVCSENTLYEPIRQGLNTIMVWETLCSFVRARLK